MPRGAREASEIFREVLHEAAEQLALSSRSARSFKQSGIRGDERASALASFLRRHLPSGFDVQKGEAIDFSDARTGQLDLVIFDRARSAPVLVGEENCLLPCESMFVVIEVKTTLTQAELDSAYSAALKVRRLRPFKSQFVGSRRGGAAADDNLCRCMYAIFAHTTNLGDDDWMSNEFRRAQVAAEGVNADVDAIDRIFVLDRGMINPVDATGKTAPPDDGTLFLEFYVHIMNFISREHRRRPPVDWQVYSARTSPGWVPLSNGGSGRSE